jgi:hypothetical protein
MTINKHITTFAGLPVKKVRATMDPPDDPGGYAWRLTTNYDGGPSRFKKRFEALVNADWVGQVTAIVVGDWGDANDDGPPLKRLIGAADRFTGLRALFLGEMTGEESEVSWINQSDVAPLLAAYPRLEVLRVRGGEGLEISPVKHESLRELAFETGGLPVEVVRGIEESDLPGLQHLELWLGTDNYGGDVTVDDLSVVLSGARWPLLSYLGLRDSEIADQVADSLAGAPVVARLSTLDLSLGMLSDVGAAALLAGQPLTHLRRLDLHHHFLSPEMMDRMRAELEAAGVELDLSKAQGSETDPGDRFISVSE